MRRCIYYIYLTEPCALANLYIRYFDDIPLNLLAIYVRRYPQVDTYIHTHTHRKNYHMHIHVSHVNIYIGKPKAEKEVTEPSLQIYIIYTYLASVFIWLYFNFKQFFFHSLQYRFYNFFSLYRLIDYMKIGKEILFFCFLLFYRDRVSLKFWSRSRMLDTFLIACFKVSRRRWYRVFVSINLFSHTSFTHIFNIGRRPAGSRCQRFCIFAFSLIKWHAGRRACLFWFLTSSNSIIIIYR